MDHLILGCVFSREVWKSCLRNFRLHNLIAVQQEDIMFWWTPSRKLLPKDLRRGFDSHVLLAGWLL
jgi:hypothetical protein